MDGTSSSLKMKNEKEVILICQGQLRCAIRLKGALEVLQSSAFIYRPAKVFLSATTIIGKMGLYLFLSARKLRALLVLEKFIIISLGGIYLWRPLAALGFSICCVLKYYEF